MKDNFDDKNDKGKCIEFRRNDWEAEERRQEEENIADFEKYVKEKMLESDILMDDEFELSKEIFDEFLAGVEKSFKKDCKRKMEWSLEEIISHLKKDEIKAKLTTLSIEYLKSDRKVKLIEHYLKNYEKSYKELFEYITEDVYKDLMKLKIQEYNIDLDLIEELKYPGLLDILGIGTIGVNEDGDIRYFIPKEIANVIENYSFDKKNMKKNDLILKVTKGLLRVYGVIPKEKLMEFLIEYKVIKEEEDLDKINAIIKMNIAAEESLIFTEAYYLDSAIAFIENLRMVMDRKGEYKRFTKKEVLEIKPMEEEIKKSNFINIRNFLRQFNIEEEDIEEEILEMYDRYQLSTDSEKAVITHIENNYDMPDTMKEEHSKEVLKVFNNMPNWKLKGFSKNEVENKNYKVINEIKKNRSELCTCGSNKKFKECCGEKVIKVDFKRIK